MFTYGIPESGAEMSVYETFELSLSSELENVLGGVNFGLDEKLSFKLNNKIQLNATYYFIMLMLGSTCFGHHYAHHQEFTTIALVTTYAVWFSSFQTQGYLTAFGPETHTSCLHLTPNQHQLEKQKAYVVTNAIVVSFNSLRSGNSSILPALNFHPAATREPDGLCGKQRYRRELLMMGIMVPERC